MRNSFALITSKPQTSTVISFVLFLLITIVVVAMNCIGIINHHSVAWYNYAVIGILTPLGLFVFFKIVVRHKILKLGNNQIQIDYPFLRQSKVYSLEQIDQWVENKVKTGKNSEYKELQIRFSDGRKVSLGHKEHTEYGKMVQYLVQKAPKKKASLA